MELEHCVEMSERVFDESVFGRISYHCLLNEKMVYGSIKYICLLLSHLLELKEHLVQISFVFLHLWLK